MKIAFIIFGIVFTILVLIVWTCTHVDILFLDVLVILSVMCFGFYAVLDKLEKIQDKIK